MIDREVNSLKEEYAHRLAAQGINWENLVKAQGEDKMLESLKRASKFVNIPGIDC